jgi:hypothetical protein
MNIGALYKKKLLSSVLDSKSTKTETQQKATLTYQSNVTQLLTTSTSMRMQQASQTVSQIYLQDVTQIQCPVETTATELMNLHG